MAPGCHAFFVFPCEICINKSASEDSGQADKRLHPETETASQNEEAVLTLYLWQAAPEYVIHREGLHGSFHYTRGRIIHQIGRNAQGLRK